MSINSIFVYKFQFFHLYQINIFANFQIFINL